MSVKFEAMEYRNGMKVRMPGQKARVTMPGQKAREAFSASIRKFVPPLSPEERYKRLLDLFEDALCRRQEMARRMKAALKTDDAALIKNVAEQWVDLEIWPPDFRKKRRPWPPLGVR